MKRVSRKQILAECNLTAPELKRQEALLIKSNKRIRRLYGLRLLVIFTLWLPFRYAFREFVIGHDQLLISFIANISVIVLVGWLATWFFTNPALLDEIKQVRTEE